MSRQNEKKTLKLGLDNILIIAFAAVILLVNITMVGKCYNPFVFNDEAGYWAHASYMAGLDWTGVSPQLAWYSYGYSVLLAPLLKFAPSPTAAYRSAIVLNILMDIGVYFMYIFISRFIFPKITKVQAGFISAAAALYTSYQHNSAIAFSETALLFFVTLLAFFIVLILKKPTVPRFIILGALCAYCFMIHNRCIGIVASACFIVLLLLCFKRIKLVHAASFAGVFAVGMGLSVVFRRILESHLWHGRAGGNDSGSIITKVKTICSSLINLRHELSLFESQAFAAFSATLGIALFAFWAISRCLVKETITCFKNRKNHSENVPESKSFLLLFILCAFLASWAISSVFLSDFRRIDHVVYTRYFDMTVGLLILTGLGSLFETDKADFIFAAIMPLIMYKGAERASSLMQIVTEPVFNSVCSPGLVKFYRDFGQNFFGYAVLPMAVFSIFLLLSLIKQKNIGKILPSILAAVLFISYAGEAKEGILKNQDVGEGDRQLVSRLSDVDYDQIYVSPECGTFVSLVQFLLPEQRIEMARDITQISENSIFIIDCKDIINYRDYECLDNSDRHLVLKNRKNNTDSKFELSLDYMKTFDYSLFNGEEILSNPASNYLCYGPYMDFDEGNYNISVELDDIVSESEEIGFVEINSQAEGEVYAHTEITADMVKNGSLDLELNADVNEDAENVEIIVFIYEPSETSMKLSSIKFAMED